MEVYIQIQINLVWIHQLYFMSTVDLDSLIQSDVLMQVVIGEQFVVPAYSKVSLLRQPINQDSDEELEYADDSGVADNSR